MTDTPEGTEHRVMIAPVVEIVIVDGNVVSVIIDHSESMTAFDGDPTKHPWTTMDDEAEEKIKNYAIKFYDTVIEKNLNAAVGRINMALSVAATARGETR